MSENEQENAPPPQKRPKRPWVKMGTPKPKSIQSDDEPAVKVKKGKKEKASKVIMREYSFYSLLQTRTHVISAAEIESCSEHESDDAIIELLECKFSNELY